MKTELQYAEEVKEDRPLVKVLPCSCEHSAQDKLHGKGRRVHNRTKLNKQASEQRYRCTVCKKEQ